MGSNQPEDEIEVRMLVCEDGFFRKTEAGHVTVENEGRTVIDHTTEIVDIGGTTVERPDWYDDAIDAQPEEPNGPGGDQLNESPGNESPDEGNLSARLCADDEDANG